MASMQAARPSLLKVPGTHETKAPGSYALRHATAACSTTHASSSRFLDGSTGSGLTLHLAGAGLRMDTRLACIRQAPLFRGLSLGDCTYIASQSQERHLSRRQMLFSQGEIRRHVFLIVSGRLKLTQLGPSGDEVILWLRGPGDVVGGLGSAPRTTNDSGAQAIEPCHVVFWDAGTIDSLSERFPVLQRNMVTILVECLHGIQDRFHELATEKVASRLARTLVRLLGSVGQRTGEVVRIGLSREELAQMTGTTLFAVSRLLSEWTQRGIIDARREAVLIFDDSRLFELAGEEAAA
jgi:CRP/FNR family transcriptional regulator, nitrogen oxide reductase regulator